MAAKETLSGTVFCSGCMLTFIFLSMIALGVYTAGELFILTPIPTLTSTVIHHSSHHQSLNYYTTAHCTNTPGPTSNRDISRHTPFYFIKETGCDRRQLPWFGTNYNMTLDDKGWQVMPGWALCPGITLLIKHHLCCYILFTVIVSPLEAVIFHVSR